MLFKKRIEFETQTDWLFYLYNNLGCEELALQMSGTLPNGEIWFSKRYKYTYLMDLDPFERIPLSNNPNSKTIPVCTFLQKATHRTILDIELVFDVDDEPILETAQNIIKKYAKNNPVCYFTGSKSYHIHIFDERLRNSNMQRFRQKILLNNNSDSGKGSSNQLIALEGAPHYRSGKIKEEVVL